MPILVDGRLRQSSWEDKDGNKRSKVIISVEYFNFCGGKDSKDMDDEPTTKAPETTKDAKFAEDLEEEDVPF
jgi:single-stranded DNA-binding protein